MILHATENVWKNPYTYFVQPTIVICIAEACRFNNSVVPVTAKRNAAVTWNFKFRVSFTVIPKAVQRAEAGRHVYDISGNRT